MDSELLATARDRVLPCFAGLEGASLTRIASGLINTTLLADVPDGRRWVLQRVSPIFAPAIHENIRAVTSRLADAGLSTPTLAPTKDGQWWADLGSDGIWRVMSWVGGASFDVVQSAEQARSAGQLVARFHAALDGLDHTFRGLRSAVHDTPRHLQRLRDALTVYTSHRLFADVEKLGAGILAASEALPPLPTLPHRICHGDLKLNNLLFESTHPPGRDRAVCLIDLDTVGPMSLAHEMGDAWRSWCNRGGEDVPDATLDLEVLSASLGGYLEGLGRPLSGGERAALLLGPEWISLELSARFAADALGESYFGWDPSRFAGRGEHNLVRARGQWSLHRAFVGCREQRTRLLDDGT